MAEEKKAKTTKKVEKKEEVKKVTKKTTTKKTTTKKEEPKKETKVKVVKEEVAKKTPAKKVTKKVEEEPKKQPTKEELLDRTMIFDGAQKKNLKEVVENLEKENVVLKDKVIKRSKIKRAIVIILLTTMVATMVAIAGYLGREIYKSLEQEKEYQTLNTNLYEKVNSYRNEIEDKTTENKKEEQKEDKKEKEELLNKISLLEFENKVLKKEDMTVLISSSTCLWCMQFEPIIEEVLKEQEKKMYVIEITSMEDEEVTKFREYYAFTITPTIFSIKDGVVTAEQTGITTKEELTDWVTKNMK